MTVDLTAPLEGLKYERKDHIAYITIDRPDRGNALHKTMVEPMKARLAIAMTAGTNSPATLSAYF